MNHSLKRIGCFVEMRVRRLFMVFFGFGCLSSACFGQVSLFDARFDEVRRASVAWDRKIGPEREVLDLVCLVPDVASFYKALACWDQRHYFPILIDDVETSLKFLKAFRPSRVVRFPKDSSKPENADVWAVAQKAVGQAWSPAGTAEPEIFNALAPPKALGETPPGVVVSYPESPSLPAAVALAAGRFQPLLQWKPKQNFVDYLKLEEAEGLAADLEKAVSKIFPDYDALGDDLDFVTLVGEYPYRYDNKGDRNAFDDLILRTPDGAKRWAYAGRIGGDPIASVYRAMCSLFLKPSSALLYNAYKEDEKPWSAYSMQSALSTMNTLLPSSTRNGARATLAGWHQAFDPFNKNPLLLLNTHGGPTEFHLDAGPGQTADIPEGLPTAVLMIHSFSADSPEDPQTLAGRWLANGAFLYFGSMNEPFLEAFRPPSLVSSFLAENLPVVTAVRRGPGENFSTPWRLVFFGDPLYRIRPIGPSKTRSVVWGKQESWPAYVEFKQPKPDAPEVERLNWVLKTAIFRQQVGVGIQQKIDLPTTILGISREKLEPRLRTLYDELLVAILLPANRSAVLLEKLLKIPTEENSPAIQRHRETLQMAMLQKTINDNDIRAAVNLWNDVARIPGSRDFFRVYTSRVGRLAESPVRQSDWRKHLIAALKINVHASNQDVVNQELSRVTKLVGDKSEAGVAR